jgi:RNA 3'-terminal phosphate cyclase (ATP)
MPPAKPVTLDGRTGEGGGQVVRLAVSLSSITGIPIRITHVRGNRAGGRGGGLKAQHVASLSYLASATDAVVSGLSVGSHTLEFAPRRRPWEINDRKIRIVAESAAASTLLVFQAVLPFLLFAGGTETVELEIVGGTNVNFSLSYEYADQVLLPALEERFGVVVERRLRKRAWSAGRLEEGEVWFGVRPLGIGETLKIREEWRDREYGEEDFEVTSVDVTILAPGDMRAAFQIMLVRELESAFPGVEVVFKVVEDTALDSKVYLLCVAKSHTLRWGRDCLTTVGKRGKKADVVRKVSRQVCRELSEEVESRATVDEYLQDQLVVFQALAEGTSSFPRSGMRPESEDGLREVMAELDIGERMRRDKTAGPFGEGSTHTTTARWVTAELLDRVQWYNKGRICQGVGMKTEEDPGSTEQ